ncbi:hypothetical protein EDB19DRAFT_1681582, partial [Suillus lakei]
IANFIQLSLSGMLKASWHFLLGRTALANSFDHSSQAPRSIFIVRGNLNAAQCALIKTANWGRECKFLLYGKVEPSGSLSMKLVGIPFALRFTLRFPP